MFSHCNVWRFHLKYCGRLHYDFRYCTHPEFHQILINFIQRVVAIHDSRGLGNEPYLNFHPDFNFQPKFYLDTYRSLAP